MIPIFGAILGLLGSILPEGIKFLKDRQDKKHELEIMKLQIQMQAQGHMQRLEEIVTEADVRDSESARNFAEIYKPENTGMWWYDLLMLFTYIYNSTVRPTITYIVILLYGFFKYAQFQLLKTQSNNIYDAIVKVWQQDDTMLTFTIVTFWFGGRQILRSVGKVK